MLYIAGAILFSSWLTIAFKIAERFRISTFQAIIFNYITCVVTGICLVGQWPDMHSVYQTEWFPWAVCMGLMFVCVFNLVAYTTKKSGLAITSVANKLSLVIPFLFSFILYNETIHALKIAGILIALMAVWLTCLPANEKQQPNGLRSELLFLPFLLFIGSGLQDTLIKYVEQHFIDQQNNNAYIITTFGMAGLAGAVILLVQLAMGKEKFDPRAVAAGILIGVPNYFSLLFLVTALKQYTGNSSVIIPVINMGIVLFSTLIAAIFFKERLTRLNILGIILSVLAIALIAFS